MNTRAIFGIGMMMSMVSSATIAALYVWPWLRSMERSRAMAALVVPHMLLRFIGMSFLVVGVVGPALPAGFAEPAAFGDFLAGILAIGAGVALARRLSWAEAAVWVFNVWGAVDLLLAIYEGVHHGMDPGSLGAAYFLPTLIVPALLVTHLLLFGVLRQRQKSTNGELAGSIGSLPMDVRA